jgi:5-methylcytosine-specific restriction endonuclease McrA
MRDSSGRFVKGCKKTENWYKAMEERTGENHSMWKPELHKVEMVECACGCGELFNKYDSRGRERKYIKNHFNKVLGTVGCRNHTPETIEKIREAKKGKRLKKEGEYILPKSKRERGEFRREIQKRVFERDDYTCQVCNERGGDLQVDHIQSWADYPELRFEMDNCRTVCMSCHYYLTFKRKLPKGIKWGHNFSKAQKQVI